MHPVKLAAATVVGGVSLLGLYAAAGWSVQAELETAARLISNRAMKQDRLPLARAVPPVAAPKLVTRIEVLGSGERIVTLEDASGQVVYRSDPIRQETVISRGSPVPSGEPPAPSVPALGSADPFAAEFGAPAPGDAEAANKRPRG